ncbi:MAG: hypothetical protein ACLP36_15075 [Acidimicrobiales bacterium]
MTAEPHGPKLPPTEIVPPRGLWRFVLTRVLTVAAIALVMVWAISNSRKGMIEAVVFLAVIILIATVEVPLLQRRWRREEERRLASLPGDAIYAGPARAESPPGAGGGRPVPGELVLDRRGLSFTPRRPGQVPALSIAWAEMSNISLRPVSAAPLAGSLVLTLAAGSTQSFVVQRCASLADKLQHLPERV